MTPRLWRVCWTSVTGLALGVGGCETSVPPPVDDVPPTVTANLIFPAGNATPIDEAEYLLNTSDVRVELTADEPVIIYYTTDGTAPGPDSPGGRGTNVASIRLVAEDLGEALTAVRWRVEDLSGNAAPAGAVNIRFDTQAPDVFFDPPPGEYDGPIEVVIDTDEPVDLIYYTVNGGMPQAGAPNALSGPPPVVLQLTEDSVIRAAATDAVGNRYEAPAQEYFVDSVPPTSSIHPPQGHYLVPITVDIRLDDPDAQVHYTTDGSEPTADSPVWAGAQAIDASVTLRYRGIDVGGNTEAVQVAAYTIGPRAPRDPVIAADYAFDFDGGLQLAAALAEVAGPLSGRAGAPSTPHDWTAWATARTVIDAAVFQSAVGVHLLRSPAFGAYAISDAGSGDANANGSVLDDTFADRIATFAERAGARVPQGLHPLVLFYQGARAELLVPTDDAVTADGRPAWEEAFSRVRWEGARATDRVATPGATAAGLRALAARARIGTLHEHPAGDDAFGTTVGPLLNLRCGGCHRANAAPPVLARAQDYIDAGLVIPNDVGASPLVDLLSGATMHPVDPMPLAQRAQITAWIADGAQAVGAARLLGNDGRDGLMAQLAAETAAHALNIAADWLFFDPATRRLADATDGTWHIARARINETAADNGLPRPVESINPELAQFQTRSQARLALALSDWVRLGVDRPALTEGPLASTPEIPNAPTAAAPLLRYTLAALRAQGRNPDGGYAAFREPQDGSAQPTDALATAWALRALRAADEDDGIERAGEALRGLIGPDGDVASARIDMTLDPGRPLLAVQMVTLRALLDDGAAGAFASRDAATGLWERLRTAWWDPEARVFQTSLGLADYVYTPALAAQVIDALAAAARADLPDAQAILDAFVAQVIGTLRATETWLTGEFEHAGDGDGDGVGGIGSIPPDGVAPVFVDRVTF